MSDDKLSKPDLHRQLMERAAHYGASTIKDATSERYHAEFGLFQRWAESMGLPSLPSDVPTVACYLAALADGNVESRWKINGHEVIRKKPYKYPSICHAYTAIIHVHQANGHDWPRQHPAITQVMRGIAMRIGTRKRKMTPITIDDLRTILGTMGPRRFEDLKTMRNRAMLSVLFFGAFRRSELAALKVEDLTWTEDGALIVLVRRSKMDRLGEGEQVGIHPQKDPKVCPVALLKEWLEKSGTKAGTIFRRMDRNDCIGNRPMTGPSITRLVKDWVEGAGWDATDFGAHSLRAGFATTASVRGSGLDAIMRHGRWKDERVARSYIRPATVLIGNATEGLGDDDGDD